MMKGGLHNMHLKIHVDCIIHTSTDVLDVVKGRVHTLFLSEGCSQICANVIITRFDTERFIVTWALHGFNIIYLHRADVPVTLVTKMSREAAATFNVIFS